MKYPTSGLDVMVGYVCFFLYECLEAVCDTTHTHTLIYVCICENNTVSMVAYSKQTQKPFANPFVTGMKPN